MIQIFLLGGLRILVDDQPFRFVALPRTGVLLAYLLLHAQTPLARHQAAYALWPEVGEAEARSNLRRHLHDLRRALPPAPDHRPWLLIDNETIQWNREADAWIDVVAFAHLCADPARRAEAISLYTADLLPTLAEEWAVLQRERLRTLLLDTLVDLIHQHRAQGDYTRAIGYAEQLLQHEPLREDVVREIMTLRQASGDRTGALQAYTRFAQQLRTALDVPPMLETSALYDAIARQINAPAAPSMPAPQPPAARTPARPPGNLPAQLTTFIGREGEITTIRTLLTAPVAAVRLLTLTGAGGCGKSRLALEVAARLQHEQPDRFPDGAFFVPLANVRESSGVAAAIAGALNLHEHNSETFLTGLQEHLRPRRLLLILDNFEQVMAAAPLLIDLLSSAPGLQIIITSRAVLRLYGEHEFPVAPLAAPPADAAATLESIARYDAVALFTTRARAVNPNVVLTPDNAQAIAEICRQLDGLPLAIELAAARSKLLTPQALLTRLTGALGARLAFLVDRNRNLAQRHQTLRATLAWSYNLLAPAEQQLLQHLAVFAESFSYEAVEALCAEYTAIDVLTGLETLVDNSLLARVETEPSNTLINRGEDELRFHMLSIIREYALEALGQGAEAEAVHRRHASYFFQLVETAEPRLKGAEQIEWLRRLEQERENWRAALRWCLQGGNADVELGLHLAAGLGLFWQMVGYWAEGKRWLTQALTRADAPPPALRAKALLALGVLINTQGDFEQARPLLEQSLELYRTLADASGAADALYALGRLANRQARYVEAESLLQESLRQAQLAGDPFRVPYALNILAFIYLARQDQAQAHATYEQALAVARANGDQSAVAFILTAVGELARQENDYVRAAQFYNEAMRLAQELGQKTRVMMLMHNLAYVALHEGQIAQAAMLFADCLKLGIELPDKENVGMCLIGLGCVATAAGRLTRAVQLFGAGVALLEQLGAQLDPADQREFDPWREAARQRLDPQTYTTLWQQGHSLTLEAAQTLALTP
jgi:predicted ATPase/DNA-binding SARP family transcriptional activator